MIGQSTDAAFNVLGQLESILGVETFHLFCAERISRCPARFGVTTSLAAVDGLLKSLFEVHHDFFSFSSSSSSVDFRS
jgi:hypothetical protein